MYSSPLTDRRHGNFQSALKHTWRGSVLIPHNTWKSTKTKGTDPGMPPAPPQHGAALPAHFHTAELKQAIRFSKRISKEMGLQAAGSVYILKCTFPILLKWQITMCMTQSRFLMLWLQASHFSSSFQKWMLSDGLWPPTPKTPGVAGRV